MINWLKRNSGTLVLLTLFINIANISWFVFGGVRNTLTYIGVGGAIISCCFTFVPLGYYERFLRWLSK